MDVFKHLLDKHVHMPLAHHYPDLRQLKNAYIHILHTHLTEYNEYSYINVND